MVGSLDNGVLLGVNASAEFVALPGGHLQTLWPSLVRPRREMDLGSERIELPMVSATASTAAAMAAGRARACMARGRWR